jgi:integrase
MAAPFRAQAPRYHAALALFMFATGARIGQAVAMHPSQHLDLQNARVCIPGAKGHADRWITVPMELVVELANLPAKTPRGWERKPRRTCASSASRAAAARSRPGRRRASGPGSPTSRPTLGPPRLRPGA